jgi:ABC-2 type transport system ATP-binding protein
MSTLLEVNKVVKQYGDVALNEVSLTVPKEVFMDFGSKWCWKTSLIRIINQITLPDSGEIILTARNCSPGIQYIAIFQKKEGLYNSMKVENNVCIWPK